jgi:hypothetical protein
MLGASAYGIPWALREFGLAAEVASRRDVWYDSARDLHAETRDDGLDPSRESSSSCRGSAAKRRLFKLAIESSPNGVVIVARAGTIVMANARLEWEFGYEQMN